MARRRRRRAFVSVVRTWVPYIALVSRSGERRARGSGSLPTMDEQLVPDDGDDHVEPSFVPDVADQFAWVGACAHA